ncbi:MAG: hypothetical protein ACD_19C00324G0001 [uncultured bacterium]|nr:MAG: hypothetical protein ACD_19C00324G0001 [uncultured bacterium]
MFNLPIFSSNNNSASHFTPLIGVLKEWEATDINSLFVLSNLRSSPTSLKMTTQPIILSLLSLIGVAFIETGMGVAFLPTKLVL